MPSRPHRTLAGMVLALVVGGAMVAGYQSWQQRGIPEELRGVLRAEATPLPAFALRDHRGERLGPADLQGRWTLVSFGFTHCPDVCPANLMQLSAAVDRLPPQEQPRILFVSVDPERDTTEVLASYVDYFHASMVGATGDDDALRSLAQPLGAFHRVEHAGGAHGDHGPKPDIAHSADAYLIDPQGRYVARFEPPLPPARVAEQIRRIRTHLDEAGG